jgi:tripartite-type tricarboxylate transporter receptor subunit TctC
MRHFAVGKALVALCAIASFFALPLPVQAQNYPNRPITIVSPFAAGGPSDAVTRVIAQSMSENLGQPVLIDNTAGAGGTIGTAKVARATPDGYMLLLHHIGHATSVALYKKLPYDPIADFAPIGMVAVVPSVISTKKDLKLENIAGLVEYLRKNASTVIVGDAGIGSASQLCNFLLAETLGVKRFESVSYKGTGPAINDLLSGQYDLLCDLVSIISTYIQSGRLNGYAVTTVGKVPTLPQLPTLDASGFAGFDFSTWYGLYAPAGTPEPIIAKLSEALAHALQDPQVKARLEPLGAEPYPVSQATPVALRTYLKSEIDRWTKILRAGGVQPN